jgi:hypothetical protein
VDLLQQERPQIKLAWLYESWLYESSFALGLGQQGG